QCRQVKNPPQPLPAGLPGIVKDRLLRHLLRAICILSCCCGRVKRQVNQLDAMRAAGVSDVAIATKGVILAACAAAFAMISATCFFLFSLGLRCGGSLFFVFQESLLLRFFTP